MPMKSFRMTVLAAVAALSAASVFVAGCDTGSPNTVERNVAVDYTGIYTGQNPDNMIASKNSGAPVTQMNLRQTGANLEAVDNNGALWKGKIGNSPDAENLTATFTLHGKTTANNEVTISGSIAKDSAGATEAQMSGTWIEPSFYAIVSARGTVSATSTNSGGGNFTISPPSATVAVGGSASFTASGASGTITWSVSGGGAVNPTTGTSTTFTRTTAGTVTLTGTDSNGGSATATIN